MLTGPAVSKWTVRTTYSLPATPHLPGGRLRGFDLLLGGDLDVFVAKLSSSGSNIWSTYVGGSADESMLYGRGGIAVNADGAVLVTGTTTSSGWVKGEVRPNYSGGADGFVIKISSTGLPVWSTYLGGFASDYGRGIAVDPIGNVLVVGYTHSVPWVRNGYDVDYGGLGDGFVAKLTALGSTCGRATWVGEMKTGPMT